MSARLDTVTAIPSARPPVPTAELLFPGMKPAVATYTVRRPFWCGKRVREESAVIGIFLSCLGPAAYAIAQLLGGVQ